MPSSEEINAIFDRILAGQATEADIHALRLELQQGKYRIEAEQLNANEIHIGDRIYHGADAEAIRAVLRSVLDEQQKLLEQQRAKRPRLERDFLRIMKAEVADCLKQSLHHAVLINLGKEEQPEQVERLWDAKIKVADHPNVVLLSDTKIIEVFDREDIAGRLLILGNPGSGKTTTLLELAKALTDRAETDPDFLMPVLFNLSSWKDNNQPLHEWMVQELKLRGVRSDITHKWLDKRKLLPMLDGLDEMKSDRQETCVEAINNQLLTGEKSLPYLVVCSRNEEYDNYETKLLLNGAIHIQELTIDKIQSYLNSVGQSELCHALDYDPNLLALVRTPLFLSIVALAFQELSYERWQTLTTTEARIEDVLDTYIRQMLERPIPDSLYGKQQLPPNRKTRKWLIWLAQQMQRGSRVEFMIERMQPSWLQTKNLSSYHMHYWLVLGLILGLHDGLIGVSTMWLNSIPMVFILIKLCTGITSGLSSGFILGLISKNKLRSTKPEIKTAKTINWSWREARKGLILGLSYSVVSSLFTFVWLLVSSLSPIFKLINPLKVLKGEWQTLAFKMLIDSIFGSIYIDLLIAGLVVNVAFYGLILAAILGTAGYSESSNIEIIEATKWDWQEGKKGFTTGASFVIYGAAVVIVSYVTIGLFIRLLTDPTGLSQDVASLGMGLTIHGFILSVLIGGFLIGVFFGLTFAPLGGLIGGLKGLRGVELEKRTSPNQGVWRSATNAAFYGLIFGVIGGLTGGIIAGSLLGLPQGWIVLTELAGEQSLRVTDEQSQNYLVLILTIISWGSLAGLIAGLKHGGVACIQHFSLRLTLFRNGYIPWNYAQFLNYCTERSLLQRVGGRYQFIHRLLQEHFAAMPFKGIEADQQRPIP